MKICTKCNTSKDEFEFGKDKSRSDGLYPYCKQCNSAYCKSKYNVANYRIYRAEWYRKNSTKVKAGVSANRKNNPKYKNLIRGQKAKRKSAMLARIPKWADLKAIREFYRKCPHGMEVDHIIPLQGKNVSGLHVLDNLQYLSKSANRSKGNKFPT